MRKITPTKWKQKYDVQGKIRSLNIFDFSP